VLSRESVYEFNDGGYQNFDISNSGNLIITSIGRNLLLYPFKKTSSLIKQEERNDFLYPNPATGEVTIDLSNHTLKGMIERVRVYDVKGMCVITSPPAPLHSGEGSKVRLDVSHLPPGVYFVQIGSRVQRFVKL